MIARTSLLTLLWLGLAAAIHAQSTLPDLLNAADANWMIGSWVAETDDGQTVTQSFTWDLDKNVINTQVKNPRWDAKGMIAVDPDNSEVQHFAVTSTGSLIRGTWSEEGGQLILKIKVQSREGRSWSGAVTYKKADEDTMKLEVYRLNSAGQREDSPGGEMTFKRKK